MHNGSQTNEGGFGTPIVLFNFNRPKLTRQIFEVVRKIKPTRLFLIADGPRQSWPEDERLCAEVRAIFDEIDWECEVWRDYSDTNLGCSKRIFTGLDWVFENAEEAIILEDDCLPSLSFFPYCEELLARYRNDHRVSLISGTNFDYTRATPNNESYFFSRYGGTWGWASWRRTWQQVDQTMSWWDSKVAQKMLIKLFPEPNEWKHWYRLFQEIYSGTIKNEWDYQLLLSCFRYSQCRAVPRINLISNIGFGGDATHCIDEYSALNSINKDELEFPLIHPLDVTIDERVEHEIYCAHIEIKPSSLFKRITKRIVTTFTRANSGSI